MALIICLSATIISRSYSRSKRQLPCYVYKSVYLNFNLSLVINEHHHLSSTVAKYYCSFPFFQTDSVLFLFFPFSSFPECTLGRELQQPPPAPTE